MMDDRMDRTIDEAAAEYHRPPAPPREEIWARVQAARRPGGAAGGGAAAPTGPGHVIPFRRRATRIAVPVGVAALLALAFGLGRVSVDPGAERSVVAAGDSGTGAPAAGGGRDAPLLAGGPAAAEPPADRADTPAAAGGDTGAARDGLPARQEDAAQRSAELARRGDDRTRRTDDEDASAEGPAPRAAEPGEPSVALAAAAREHLAQTETFLTLFRASVSEGRPIEPIVPATARHLLASNRLLIDSPAGDDPAMHRLLGDVELVLAQIAQFPADTAAPPNGELLTADERLITDGMEQRDLLFRIRAAADGGRVMPNHGAL